MSDNSKTTKPITSNVEPIEEKKCGEISNELTEAGSSHPSGSDQTRNETSRDGTAAAKLSTKKSGNKNALRHGGYFHGLLPWESSEEFEALHERLKVDWRPVGILQEEAVLSLCQWMWKRRRVILASEISYFRSSVPEGLKTGELCWDDVVAHQCSVPAKVEALISAQLNFADSLSKFSNKIGEHYYWTNTTEGKDIQSQLTKMSSDVNNLAGHVRMGVLDPEQNIRTVIEKITNLFDQAYQPEEIEKHARLLAMFEREIDKSIKRLIFLKTFSEDLAPQGGARNQTLLHSPPVVPSEAPTAEEKAKPTED